MENQYPSLLLERAVNEFSRLPGIGRKTALRLVLNLLRQDVEEVERFTDAVLQLRKEVRRCRICHNISDTEICPICSDSHRNRRLICVVENIQDVMAVERTGQFYGLYHVLGGIISPINGIGPSDLTIKELVQRVAAFATPEGMFEADAPGIDGAPAEVILALSGDVEGETTAFYIYRQISQYGVKVSSLARGLGFGDDLEYADELTLGRSIINRQIFKP